MSVRPAEEADGHRLQRRDGRRHGDHYTLQIGLERETRLELATLCLGSRCSTTELLPLAGPHRPAPARSHSISLPARRQRRHEPGAPLTQLSGCREKVPSGAFRSRSFACGSALLVSGLAGPHDTPAATASVRIAGQRHQRAERSVHVLATADASARRELSRRYDRRRTWPSSMVGGQPRPNGREGKRPSAGCCQRCCQKARQRVAWNSTLESITQPRPSSMFLRCP